MCAVTAAVEIVIISISNISYYLSMVGSDRITLRISESCVVVIYTRIGDSNYLSFSSKSMIPYRSVSRSSRLYRPLCFRIQKMHRILLFYITYTFYLRYILYVISIDYHLDFFLREGNYLPVLIQIGYDFAGL